MTTNSVLTVPPLAPADAAAVLLRRLALETDVADVRAALAGPDGPGFVLVDSRSSWAWERGHIAGAVHLPTADIPVRAAALLRRDVPVVTYCWGPACNGATRAALALAQLGFAVKEMIGGFEYWVREGLPVATAAGVHARPVDPLVRPTGAG